MKETKWKQLVKIVLPKYIGLKVRGYSANEIYNSIMRNNRISIEDERRAKEVMRDD